MIATGPGPRWLRHALAGVAAIYFIALLHHPPQWRGLRVAGFFTETTCLFPHADVYAIDYRLDAWSCADVKWKPIDPRAFFPIQPDDKESRFQRFGYFYQHNKAAMHALESWVETKLPGIGGVRLAKWTRAIPAVGTPIDRYEYRPLDPVPPDERRDLFYTSGPDRRVRCSAP